MKCTTVISSVLSTLALLQASDANAAPEELVALAESREAQCQSMLRRERGGSNRISDSNMFDAEGNLRPMQSGGPRRRVTSANAREDRRRTCAEAEALRAALEWEERPATSMEAVWDAVFVPLWSITTARTEIRSGEPSELTKRYEENSRRVLLGHPPSAREALSRLVSEAVTTYRASRAEVVSERICFQQASFETGADLTAALRGIDNYVAPLKAQLIDEVLSAVDPDMAARLTAYAQAAQSTVWEASPAIFSDWQPEARGRAVATICASAIRRR